MRLEPSRPDDGGLDDGDDRQWFDGALVPTPEAMVVAVRGEVDISTVPRLNELLAEALDKSSTVVVDLTNLDFLDSSGIAALVRAQERASTELAALVLRSPNRAVRRVLSISGVDQVMVIDGDGPDDDRPAG